MAHPTIQGLDNLIDYPGHWGGGGGSIVRYDYTFQGAEVDIGGDHYFCDGGSPPILFPPIGCPAPGASDYSDSADIPADLASEPPGGPAPDSLDPPPDFALILVTHGLRFSPYTIGCKNDPDGEGGFGCHTPGLGYDEAVWDLGFTAADYDSPDWQPAGITPWTAHDYDPARDPDYFDSFDMATELGSDWQQAGDALLKPATTSYTDPDPLDPNLPYVPYLWPWGDILGQTVSLSVSGDWHRIVSPGTGSTFLVTVMPYRYHTPPVHSGGWMHVL